MKEFQTDIEHGSHKGQARFNVKLEPMMKFLGFANDGQHGERGFDRHAVIPRTFFADFDISRKALGAAKAVVGQHNFVPIAQVVQEGVIRHVHFVPNPTANLSKGVEYPGYLNADTPAAFVAAFSPILLLGTTLADREY